MGKAYIYALVDPRDDSVRYVGRSVKPKARLQQHLSDKTTNLEKIAWLDDLKTIGLKPALRILEETTADAALEVEGSWIAKGHDQDWPLTNQKAGGTGTGVEQYEFFNAYIRPDLVSVFEELPRAKKRYVCWQAALAMLPVQQEGVARRKGRLPVDWVLWGDWMYEEACVTTLTLLTQPELIGELA